jgi:hypothetical protein
MAQNGAGICVYEDCRAPLPEKGGCQECGRCQCGCGELAPIALRTTVREGHVAGNHKRFVSGHIRRLQDKPSRGMLEELYRRGMSIRDIAGHLGSTLGRRPCDETVRQWLIKYNIPLREPSMAFAVAVRHKPDVRAKVMENQKRAVAASPACRKGYSHSTPDKCRASARKALAALRAARKASRIQVVCANPACGKSRSLTPAEYAKLRLTPYRCQPCGAAHLSHERRLQRLASVSIIADRPVNIPEWARENVERLHQLQQEPSE